MTHKLLAYTTGADDNLDIQAEIQGQMQEVFGEREKEHMVDVKALYLGARDVRTVSLVLAAVLIAAAFLIGKKTALPVLCRSFLWTSAGFVVAVGAISVYAAMDFTSFWTSFHHVFFTNDLWLLDPRTDVLIQMVPEQFFSDLVMRIIVRFVSIFLDAEYRRGCGTSASSGGTAERRNTPEMDKLILAIETSCDETAAAVTRGRHVLGSAVYTQPEHEKYGGVVPEIASRNHIMKLPYIVDEALHTAGASFDNLEAVAVTDGAGLGGRVARRGVVRQGAGI